MQKMTVKEFLETAAEAYGYELTDLDSFGKNKKQTRKKRKTKFDSVQNRTKRIVAKKWGKKGDEFSSFYLKCEYVSKYPEVTEDDLTKVVHTMNQLKKDGSLKTGKTKGFYEVV